MAQPDPGPSNGTKTIALGEKAHEWTIRRFRVVATAGADSGKEATSSGEEFAIGTGDGNHLQLTDRSVSRHHCVIMANEGRFLLRDLGSTNGIVLGGFRVELAYLKHGANFQLGRIRLRFECLEDEITEPLSSEEQYGSLVGRSAAMRRIFALLPRLAASESGILLEGETGTGKSQLAQAIHRASPRTSRPFVVVDCSAIPPTLIESELFGHQKGAFTGAHAARAGAFEAAAGGTVFLDEIGELPLDMQPKLLRALDERTIKRIGSTEPVQLDVRIIAATNRDLREMVNRGAFRSDLFYRLNTVRIRIPPLRERRDDIPLLVAHYYGQFVDDDPVPPPELIQALEQQELPGNVRELRSAVERAVLLGDPSVWNEIADSPSTRSGASEAAPTSDSSRLTFEEVFDPSLPFRAAKDRAVSRWERWYLRELLRRSQGYVARASRAAHMDRNHLTELIRRHKIRYEED